MTTESQLKWDLWYIDIAKRWSLKSKDPSTKCGAVIVRPDWTEASVGYNGFPKKIQDTPELYENRPEKYKRIIHCEMNAILHAREPLEGYTLYTYPFLTCDRCAVHVIQAGIARVVAPECPPELSDRWEESLALAQSLYKEAGVIVNIYSEEAYL